MTRQKRYDAVDASDDDAQMSTQFSQHEHRVFYQYNPAFATVYSSIEVAGIRLGNIDIRVPAYRYLARHWIQVYIAIGY